MKENQICILFKICWRLISRVGAHAAFAPRT
uniref:Uncharacterized protein n=1 Tax=Rhizophora mucronata TaxID=61149 RepID=A0A2P2QTS1_RHIMU